MQARKCANESHSPHLMQYVLPRDLKRVPARILLEAGPDKGGDLSDLPLPPRVPRGMGGWGTGRLVPYPQPGFFRLHLRISVFTG